MANAPLIVNALNASSGVNFIFTQASDQTKNRLDVGEEPGLKSLAKAIGIPSLIKSLAGEKGMFK